MSHHVPDGTPPPREDPRRADRISVNAEVALRRAGRLNYQVHAYDLSPLGCKLEFVERPQLEERVWIKFEGLDAIEGLVCWMDAFRAGIQFDSAIHPAVFESLAARLR